MDGQREPEVVEAVMKEIKALGDNTKANYDELRRSHEKLKGIVDKYEGKLDAGIKEQITKFSEEIATRQKALDEEAVKKSEEVTKRIDQVELALQRVPRSVNLDSTTLHKEAFDFYLNALVCQRKGEGVDYKQIDAITPNLAEFEAYKKTFDVFLRQRGDQRNLTPEQFKSLSVGVDPDGGYTVTPAMSARIFQRLYESDPVRQLCSVENITTQSIEWLIDWGEMGFGWEAETTVGPETDTADLKKKSIYAHVMYAKPHATQTLLEDSGINIENWIADKVARRFMRGEGAAFVTGDGVGKPRGFLTYANGTNYGQIEQVGMGAAADVTADGFIAVKYSLKEDYLPRGTWLMNRSTVADTMYLKDGTGAYIWKPGFARDEDSTILALPVKMSTTMPVVAANALSVVLADWREAYMIVDRLGITVQRDPYTAKPFVEFYTRKRVGGDVIGFEAAKIGKISV